MKRVFTLVVLALFASSLLAQSIDFNQGSITQKKFLEKISYQNIDGKIVVPVTINGKMYNFVIDTGATLTISDKLFKELNLQIVGQSNVMDASGRMKEARIILLPELHLQGITFIDTPGFVIQEESSDFINLLECFGIDGIIGSNMLRNLVIQFDEQSKHVLISNNLFQIFKDKVGKNVGKSQKMLLYPSQSCPYITIGLKKEGKKGIGDLVLFDTGAPDFYEMSMSTYNWLNDRVDMTIIADTEGSYGWGFHGNFEQQQHLLLSIPEFHVNEKIFNDVIVTATHSMSLIGTRLLQYGRITLDYKKGRFYFYPFDNVNTDELSEKPPAFNPVWQNDKLVVGIIWDKSLESQINLGDEIVSINGLSFENMEVCDYMKLDFCKETISDKYTLELRDIETGEVKKVEIKRM